jgi:hypothetical protein
VGGVLLSTPFGAITVGGAIGDDDHRKIFFTFGKLFQQKTKDSIFTEPSAMAKL